MPAAPLIYWAFTTSFDLLLQKGAGDGPANTKENLLFELKMHHFC